MADTDTLFFDESGTFAALRAIASGLSAGTPGNGTAPADLSSATAVPIADLNGSWYLQIVPEGPHDWVEIRGPLRIEVAPPRLRVSADIYVNQIPPSPDEPFEVLSPVPHAPLVIEGNWYPQMPFDEYAWYLRSRTAVYTEGTLTTRQVSSSWSALALPQASNIRNCPTVPRCASLAG
jgi:hypothetical protein